MGFLTRIVGTGLKAAGKVVITAHNPFSEGIKKDWSGSS